MLAVLEEVPFAVLPLPGFLLIYMVYRSFLATPTSHNLGFDFALPFVGFVPVGIATPSRNLGLDFVHLAVAFELGIAHGRFLVRLVATPPSQILEFDFALLAVAFELGIAHGRFLVRLVGPPSSHILGFDSVPLEMASGISHMSG